MTWLVIVQGRNAIYIEKYEEYKDAKNQYTILEPMERETIYLVNVHKAKECMVKELEVGITI